MKKLLLLCLVLVQHGLWAQTAEPEENTTLIHESTSYDCENMVTGDFRDFSASDFNTCTNTPDYRLLWYKFIPTKTATYAVAVEELDGTDVYLQIFKGEPGNLTEIQGACSTRYTQRDFIAGETYYMYLAGEFASTQYSACIFSLPDTPINDEPENAIPIPGASTYGNFENMLTEQHTINASHSEQAACLEASMDDVWFSFTPTETANFTARLELTNNYNPSKIAIYEGTPDNLTLISFADEDVTAPGCASVRVKADLTAGETYYIVCGINNTSRVTYFNTWIYPTPAAPVNDNCDNAIELTVGGDFNKSYIVGDITSAGREVEHKGPSCDYYEWVSFNGNGKDVWYTVTIPASGNLTIETRAFDEAEERVLNDTGMQSFVAGTCDDLEPYRYYDELYDAMVYCNRTIDPSIPGYQFAGIELKDKTPGDKILIRVYPWAHQYGRFKIAAYDDTALSVTDFDKSGFSFYPNPTTDMVNVKYTNNITSLSVMNLLGKTVKTLSTNSRDVQLDLSELAAGLYIVTAKSDKNEVTNFKVVKQ